MQEQLLHTPTDMTKEIFWLENEIKNDPEVRETVEAFDREFEFRRKLVLTREATGLTQKEIEKATKLDKRVTDRFKGNEEMSKSIKALMQYLWGLGYELDIVERTTTTI